MSEITVIGKVKAKPGREQAVEKELRAVVGATHHEPGCLRYALHRSMQDPTVFLAVERWASQRAIDQHLTTPYIRRS